MWRARSAARRRRYGYAARFAAEWKRDHHGMIRGMSSMWAFFASAIRDAHDSRAARTGVMPYARTARARPTAARTRGLLIAALLVAGSAWAQDGGELVSLINAYRTGAHTCEGRRIEPAPPLSVHASLSRVPAASGGALHEALKDAGYLAARAQVITVSGPVTAAGTMAFLEQRYCRVLSSPQYADIGVSRAANAWRIVLARPLLMGDLGDSAEAGKAILRLTNAARAQPRACG